MAMALAPPGLTFLRRAGFLWLLLGSEAASVELEDDGVMNQPVDGGHGGHLVLKNLVPLREGPRKGFSVKVRIRRERKAGLESC